MIKHLKAVNFQSWEYLEFEISKGITQIIGENYDDGTKEGSGKSAIPNSICWALFGCIPKDQGIDDVIRYGQKSCSVEVTLDTGLKIVRTRKPNDLYLIDPNKEDTIRGKDMKETQKLIENILGLSFETFMQAIYFAQNYPQKFITANEADKAKILSEIQQLEVFDKARKAAQEKLKKCELEEFSLTKDLSHKGHMLDGLEAKLEEFKDLKRRAEQENLERIEDIKGKITRTKASITELKAELKDLKEKELRQEIKENEDTLNALNQELNGLKLNLSNIDSARRAKEKLENSITVGFERLDKLEKEPAAITKEKKETTERLKLKLAELSTLKSELDTANKNLKNPTKSNCPTCNQVWKADVSCFEKEVKKAQGKVNSTTDEIEWLKQKQQENANRLKEVLAEQEVLKQDLLEKSATLEAMANVDEEAEKALKVAIKEYTETIVEVKGAQELLKDKLQNSSRLKASLGFCEDSLKEFNVELTEAKAKDYKHFDLKLADTQKALNTVDKEIRALLDELDKLKKYMAQLEVLKTGFKEVKSFVFQGVLKEINRRANTYLAELFEQPARISFSNSGDSGEISKISVKVNLGGIERGLGALSGGQSRRFSLAVDLALSDIVASRNPNIKNFMIIDEGFFNLSLESKQRVLNLLSNRQGSTIFIEHDPIFETICEQKLEIEFRDGISRRV
jgi:DNA repair exonuclease SbcCD ATPase subunit